ncbi:hypothetical protein SY94_0240 [Agrobacterium tumefaciens]|nr:hypothetical protein SY94_0240 [Agrobacterium tumefaciens]
MRTLRRSALPLARFSSFPAGPEETPEMLQKTLKM